LIDIRLPDMEGTELLTALKETTPKMIKIILTGYPALQNAIDGVNKGAHGYLVKPIKMDELFQTVKEQLKKQSESKEYGEQKLAKFVETRFKEMQAEQFDTPQATKKEWAETSAIHTTCNTEQEAFERAQSYLQELERLQPTSSSGG